MQSHAIRADTSNTTSSGRLRDIPTSNPAAAAIPKPGFVSRFLSRITQIITFIFMPPNPLTLTLRGLVYLITRTLLIELVEGKEMKFLIKPLIWLSGGVDNSICGEHLLMNAAVHENTRPRGTTIIMQAILEKGANPDGAPYERYLTVTTVETTGETTRETTRHIREIDPEPPLLYLAQHGTPGAIALLAKYGANLEVTDSYEETIRMYDDKTNKTTEEKVTVYNTPLFWAIAGDKNDNIAAFINAGANVNALNGDLKQTPLHKAVAYNKAEAVLLLLAAKAIVDAKDFNNNTPLHIAAIHCDEVIVNALINAGADLEAINNRGFTPLHEASLSNNTSAAAALVKAGAQVNSATANDKRESVLHLALCHRDRPENIKQDASILAILATRTNLEMRNSEGQTALHMAAAYEDIIAVRELIKAGADVNAYMETPTMSCYGLRPTALHIAARNRNETENNVEIIKALGAAGAYMDALDGYGETALHAWVKRDCLPLATALCNAGANINARIKRPGNITCDDYTVLHYAIEYNCGIEKIETLIALGADVNAVSGERERTPLHLAINKLNAPIVDVLLEAWPDIHARIYKNSFMRMLAGATLQRTVEHYEGDPLSCLLQFVADNNAVAKQYAASNPEATASIRTIENAFPRILYYARDPYEFLTRDAGEYLRSLDADKIDGAKQVLFLRALQLHPKRRTAKDENALTKFGEKDGDLSITKRVFGMLVGNDEFSQALIKPAIDKLNRHLKARHTL